MSDNEEEKKQISEDKTEGKDVDQEDANNMDEAVYN